MYLVVLPNLRILIDSQEPSSAIDQPCFEKDTAINVHTALWMTPTKRTFFSVQSLAAAPIGVATTGNMQGKCLTLTLYKFFNFTLLGKLKFSITLPTG